MIFKVEVLRAWDSGWDTAWIETEYDIQAWDESNQELAFRLTDKWIEEKHPVGLKHAAPIDWKWVKSDLGGYIYAGGNLAQSDLNTLKLMGRGNGSIQDDCKTVKIDNLLVTIVKKGGAVTVKITDQDNDNRLTYTRMSFLPEEE